MPGRQWPAHGLPPFARFLFGTRCAKRRCAKRGAARCSSFFPRRNAERAALQLCAAIGRGLFAVQRKHRLTRVYVGGTCPRSGPHAGSPRPFPAPPSDALGLGRGAARCLSSSRALRPRCARGADMHLPGRSESPAPHPSWGGARPPDVFRLPQAPQGRFRRCAQPGVALSSFLGV